MRVRVSIDVTLPLCRGRLISFENGDKGEGWVSFKYERLPNICYWWCCLKHVDKDCDNWIESDGTSTQEDQEYGSWIRTAPAPLNRKLVIRVPGFYETWKKKNQNTSQGRGEGSSLVAGGLPNNQLRWNRLKIWKWPISREKLMKLF